jgi:transposase
MKTILAAPNLLKIENIALYSGEVRLIVKTKPLRSACSSCGQHSAKVHSRYQRHLADLPWEGVTAKLILSVQKFFCLNLECPQKIFCERLPGVAVPYAHQTMRLNELLTSLGRALGGRPGMRMARGMGLQVGRDALLERVRRANIAQIRAVRVLGVDDFAFRRGKKYRTILIDHERRATIDFLPDREAETLAQWLKAHPGIEIVTRDRARAYELKQDQPAVVAALSYEWSNGMVEGHVNRLKLVKRTMYGRAKPDLLKARLVKAA